MDLRQCRRSVERESKDGWIDRWMDGWIDRWMDVWRDRWMDVWRDRWMDVWRDRWMDDDVYIYINKYMSS